MSAITYLHLTTNLENIQYIKDLKIQRRINEHTYLHLIAIIAEQYKDDYIKGPLREEQLILFVQEEDKSRIIFQGMIKQINIDVVSGVYQLRLKAISNSFKTDLKKTSRSFQDRNMTYEQMLQDIIYKYPDGDILDNAFAGKTISRLILQYQETDWVFFKRIASHANMGLLPSIMHQGPKIYCGLAAGEEIGALESYDYYITKNIAQYLQSSRNTNPALSEPDAIEFHVETETDYEIGDIATFQNIRLYIKSKTAELVNGILRFRYALSTEQGLSQDRLYNRQITGLTLQGTVLEAIRDKIKVQLEIDQAQDPATAWEFPYTTPYTAAGNSGWYCMPEPGDTALIHFPTQEESQGMGINSLRVQNNSGDRIDNPDIKYFRTANGKELKFSPGEIQITCINGVDPKTGEAKHTYIRLNEQSGIEIISTEPILFRTDKGLTLEAEDTIKILAAQSISLKCKTSEIKIDDEINICGEDVKIN
ncbi:MAG: phage late control D family protein [Firmicutes bacterium]|nr:phage late control D family protein [Bacillota bacterium]